MNSALATAISKDHMNHRRASDNEQKEYQLTPMFGQ